MPEEELAADLYDLTQEVMESHFMPAYEISNHAIEGQESIHNLAYWQYQDYLGLGPGAHSRVTYQQNKLALMMYHKPEKWLATSPNSLQQSYQLSNKEIEIEKIMMGLRMAKGICAKSLPQMKEFYKKISELEELNLVTFNEDYLAVTPKGRKILNYVINQVIEKII